MSNATWIHICIKLQIILGIYCINYVILLGSIPKYANNHKSWIDENENATWIYVKVCIKLRITLGIYFILNYVVLLGSIPKYA